MVVQSISLLLLYGCVLLWLINHVLLFFFFQAEDGIRDLVRSRGLGDVYKRQVTSIVNKRTSGANADKTGSMKSIQ